MIRNKIDIPQAADLCDSSMLRSPEARLWYTVLLHAIYSACGSVTARYEDERRDAQIRDAYYYIARDTRDAEQVGSCAWICATLDICRTKVIETVDKIRADNQRLDRRITSNLYR